MGHSSQSERDMADLDLEAGSPAGKMMKMPSCVES